MVIEYIIKEK